MLYCGAYSHLIFGVRITHDGQLQQNFLHSSHLESVTCVAAHGKWLATGSKDSIIWLYNMNTRKEVGCFQRHQQAITGLCFYKNRFLLSCSDDGVICVWRLKDLECIYQMKGHKGGVKALSVHPSGRMALSVGEGSRKLMLWNLMTGKCALTFKLGKSSDHHATVEGEQAHFGRDFKDLPVNVKWSPSGDKFLVQWAAQVDVLRATDAGNQSYRSFAVKSKVTCCAWVGEDQIVVGTDRGQVAWIRVEESKVENVEKIHDGSRVRDVCAIGATGDVACATSSGLVKMWRAAEKRSSVINLDDRLTCICASADLNAQDDGQEENDDDDNEDDDEKREEQAAAAEGANDGEAQDASSKRSVVSGPKSSTGVSQKKKQKVIIEQDDGGNEKTKKKTNKNKKNKKKNAAAANNNNNK